jgi:hypothetical protein
MRSFGRLQSLSDVHKTLQTVSKNYHDEVIRVDCNVSFDGLSTISTPTNRFTLLPTAQKQICAKLDVPFSYINRCDNPLQSDNLNCWLQTIRGKDLFLRMDGNNIRAIFTTRYKPINNLEITERLLKTFPDFTAVDFIHHDDIMSLGIPSDRHFELSPLDKFKSGLSIINSETGYHGFSVGAYVLRLICTNGMIMQVPIIKITKIHHIYSEFLDSFSFSDIKNNILKYTKEIQHDLSTAKEVVYEEPLEIIQKINKKFQITEKENDAFTWGLAQEPGNTLYHLINGYTKGAQYKDLSTDSQYHLQSVGGMITGLARTKSPVIRLTENNGNRE